jgi:hypothetical protein
MLRPSSVQCAGIWILDGLSLIVVFIVLCVHVFIVLY